MTLIRFPIAFVFGLLFTGGVFWGLWLAIHGPLGSIELKPAIRIEFTRLRQDTEAQRQQDEKVKRERPAQTPDLPQISSSSSNAPSDFLRNARRSTSLAWTAILSSLRDSG